MDKVFIKTKEGIFDNFGDILYKGRNNKDISYLFRIGANSKYVYVLKCLDGHTRAYYKNEIEFIATGTLETLQILYGKK